MANAKTTPAVETQPSRQEMLDTIVAQLRAQRGSSGLTLTDRIVTWATDKAADSTTALCRVGAGFVSGWDNGVTAYSAERERQLRRTANKMLTLAETSL